MQFGIQIGSNDDSVRTCAERAVLAETSGLDFIGFGDTQVIYRDCYSVLTACALATSRIHLGPVVTNPLTRHPVVLANVLATLDEASGGRAYMAIGSGASSVTNASLARAKPKELAAAIGVFRSAFRRAPGPTGRESLDESVIEIKWAKRKVPVIVHASGPLGFELAAQRGDAVMMRLGDTDADSQARQISTVRARHAQGLRAGLPLGIWMYAPLAIANTNSVIGTVSARAVTLKPELCPPELLEAHRQYVGQYDYKFHGSTREPKNFRLLEKLGLAPYMLRRYSFSGGEPELQQRLGDLQQAGITNLVVDTAGGDYGAAIESYGAFVRRFQSTHASKIAS